jgi:hypothetical protein
LAGIPLAVCALWQVWHCPGNTPEWLKTVVSPESGEEVNMPSGMSR